jgi:hypothetical protein
MLVPIRAPLLIVTGIRRAGLNLLADMLRGGSILNERIMIARDPQGTGDEPPPLPPQLARSIGLFVDRTSTKLLESIERDNAREGRPPLALFEHRTLKRQLVHDLRAARARAAEQFAPLYVFEFDKLVHDPAKEADRLANILRPHYPEFNATYAALAVRRVYHDRKPQVLKGTFRIVKP